MSQLFTDFYQEHHRAPLADKGEKPWTYRGWLLYYLQETMALPHFPFPDRWTYLYHIMQGDDPGPIPQVQITRPSSEGLKNFHQCVEIAGEYGARGWGWSSLTVFLDFLAYGTGVSTKQPDLSDEIQEKLYRTFDGTLWLLTPADYIGAYICEHRKGAWNPNAFFPTPASLVTTMVNMLMGDGEGEDQRYKSVNDPCMGTGVMLLEAGNRSLCLSGMDIDPMMVTSTKINGAFYVPWLVCPVKPPSKENETCGIPQ